MLFNSVDFALFLPCVLLLFWSMERISFRHGNTCLLLASMFFYGWWDWRYLGLVFLSGSVDHIASNRITRSGDERVRKAWLVVSILANLSILGFFKYYDFFLVSFAEAFSFFGRPIEVTTLGFILPVGISFYTFQSMSYTIDVYRRHLEPSRRPIEFGAYLMFFPQLVAGPIERGTNLLPQFRRARHFSLTKAVDGSRQMLWGLFKKVVVADQCAPYVNEVYANIGGSTGNELFLAAILFAFQIYGDFSGYSDIAIGCARLFGIDLMRNFAFPYFSRDMAEFWRRWHISLSTWFRDYVYIPLGGSRGPAGQRIRNTFLIFLISGFWHGANYTFILWGALHALLFLPLLLTGKNRANADTVALGSLFPTVKELLAMVGTFGATTVAWILFRSPDVRTAFLFLSDLIVQYFDHPGQIRLLPEQALLDSAFPLALLMLAVEWLQREKRHALEDLGIRLSTPLRWSAYYALLCGVLYYSGSEQEFIYFQF